MTALNYRRIVIIGAGHVGATAAYALMLRALVSEIVLIDSNGRLAQAEAADIGDANALARPARIWAGDYKDAVTAGIAVITAGSATHGHQSRLSVLSQSAAIVGGCVQSLIDAGFTGIILVAANPVDIMALVAFRKAGMPSHRVIGTGTLLDSSRLCQSLAKKFNIAPNAISGLVLGEHGDSEVAAFSNVRICGLNLDDFAKPHEGLDCDALAKEVREAGYRIAAGKGYTSFGVATAIVRICEAIVRDERTVLPVSTLTNGEFGIAGLFISLPCVLGADGVAGIVLPELSTMEQSALVASAKVIQKAVTELDAG